ncbi:MAG: hypothetical protein HDR88_00720 [Bacteroides sp.]|nr:hypothetical protein [Bacteroides sp.]
MRKTITLFAVAGMSAFCWANEPVEIHADVESETNKFELFHDLTVISIKDSRDHDWDGGCYTQNPTIKVGYECENANISSVRVSIRRCNGIVRADNTYTLLDYAIESNSPDIEVTTLTSGETAEFDVSVPGRYCLGYCAIGEDNETVLKGRILFDSLYDDGNWITCGDAEVSSGVLVSDKLTSHVFLSNGTGSLEDPNIIWWECPVTYPYYTGEEWLAPIEYHPVLKKYRIVDPFTRNPDFKDYFPEDDKLLSAYYDNVAYTPEAFIFDRENPAWFLINAEWEDYPYCEPMRTGIVAQHRDNPYCFIALLYNEMVGNVRYDVCPPQYIKKTGVYADMPLDDESEASIIVKFPGWTSGVKDIYDDKDDHTEYFTIDGLKISNPGKGFNIIRQGGKTSKIIY